MFLVKKKVIKVIFSPWIALLALTKMAGPTVVANTTSVLTTAVWATVQVAKADRTVLACRRVCESHLVDHELIFI